MKYLPLILLLIGCQPKTTTQVTGKVLRVQEHGSGLQSYIQFPGGIQKVLGYYGEPGMIIHCTATTNGETVYYFTMRECIALRPVAPEKPEFGQKQRLLIERPL